MEGPESGFKVEKSLPCYCPGQMELYNVLLDTKRNKHGQNYFSDEVQRGVGYLRKLVEENDLQYSLFVLAPRHPSAEGH
jgi:hypothetical protein